MLVRFSKMQSLGNDFVVIDAIRQRLDISPAAAAFIANRKRGIGCDQILIAQSPPDTESDFLFRIFNADGSESAQCGNGARCFARFLIREHLTDKAIIRIATQKSRMSLYLLDDGRVRVDMGPPVFEPEDIPFRATENNGVHHLEINGRSTEFGVLSMGNPHAVIKVEDTDGTDVRGMGRVIECHPSFPERTNVGFMQVIDRNTIKLRVFERGTGETEACGSGACAAVVSGIQRGFLDNRVTVNLPGGQVEVSWENGLSPVFLTGDSIHVFDGEINIPEL